MGGILLLTQSYSEFGRDGLLDVNMLCALRAGSGSVKVSGADFLRGRSFGTVRNSGASVVRGVDGALEGPLWAIEGSVMSVMEKAGGKIPIFLLVAS